MTRKDYVLIARALHGMRTAYTASEFSDPVCGWAVSGVDAAADALANSLKQDNPRFDRERFLKACREGC